MGKGRCYLFLGPERGEKQDALDALRKSLGPGLEESIFYAGEDDALDMVSALQNGSLFASARLFLVKSAENIRKKDEISLFVDYMAKPQDETTLVLISDETKLDKALESLPGLEKRVFWELFENRKAEWVSARFRRAGFQIQADAVETLLELVENNTEALGRECGRLLLFLDKSRPVEAADIEKWLSHSREESAFTLFSAIAAGDLSRSIDIVHSLLASGESPQAVLPGLVWCFRRLRDYTALVASGRANDFEFRKMGLASPRARKDYENAHERWHDRAGLSSADRALTLIAKCDLLTRSLGQALHGVLMDLLVCSLTKAEFMPICVVE
jgi:DNA polymerase-3 subunit delta